MKRISIFSIIFSMVILSFSSFAQSVYRGGMADLIYFGRQPSAKAEAMGKSAVTQDGDVTDVFYNPASIANLNGINFAASYASPYYFTEKASFTFFGLSYHFKGYGSVALSRFHYDMGQKGEVRDSQNQLLGIWQSTTALYSLSLASEIYDVRVGINLNAFIPRSNFEGAQVEKNELKENSYPIDFGFQYDALRRDSSAITQLLRIASSVTNLYTTKWGTENDRLPVILHVGSMYKLSYWNKAVFDNAPLYSIMLALEYQDLLNSKYRGGFRYGMEISLIDMLFLRLGYYSESLDTYGASVNTNDLSSTTFGFGFKAPINIYTHGNIPLSIKFDFTSLKQPSYSTNPLSDNFHNFINYTLSLNYTL